MYCIIFCFFEEFLKIIFNGSENKIEPKLFAELISPHVWGPVNITCEIFRVLYYCQGKDFPEARPGKYQPFISM